MAKKYVQTAENRRKVEKKRTGAWATVLYACMVIVFGICLAMVIKFQTVHTLRGTDLNEYRENRYSQTTVDLARRGTIYDRFKNPIATDVKEYKLLFYLQESRGEGQYVDDPQKTAQTLVDVLKLDEEAYDYIYDRLTPEDDSLYQVYIGKYGNGITMEQKEMLDAEQLNGIDYEESLTRYYPYGDFASYFIGYTTENENEEGFKEVTGNIGVEGQEDGYLKSENGYTQAQVDNAGVRIDDNIVERTQTDGVNIVTTIDSQIQTILETEMETAMNGLDYQQAMTIITDVDTGEVLAAYSSPSFDPNVRDLENFVDPFLDYCYEPGSTIKSFMVATAMEEGKWDPNRTNNSGERFNDAWGDGESIADYIFNMYGYAWGPITWEQGFYFSSNTSMTYILDEVGYDTYASYMTNKYLFGQAINHEYLKTSKCDYEPLYNLDYATTSFGQGMSTNVAQLTQAYSIFANGGDMLTPHYVKQLIDPNSGEVIYDSTEDSSLRTEGVISEETATQMMELFEGGVYYNENTGSNLDRGTGYKYGLGDTLVYGKSGTAQIFTSSGYDFSNLSSSFAGYAPGDDPEIFIYTIVIGTPAGSSDKMGQYFTNTVDKTIAYLEGSSKVNEQEEVESETEVIVADYIGKNIEESQVELEEQGFKTYIIGTGNVISQYPGSNQSININQTIYLAGEGDFTVQSLIGADTSTASDICKLYDYMCTFDGIGTITDVSIIDNITYEFSVEQPGGITKFDSSITKRKPLTDVITNKKDE